MLASTHQYQLPLLFNLFLLLLSLFIFYKMFYEKILGNSLAVFLIVPGAQFLFLLPTNQQIICIFFILEWDGKQLNDYIFHFIDLFVTKRKYK